MHKRTNHRKAFSLIELVIVVVIIGIIAAIAIPRMSRGSAGAADSALSGNMAVWRSALDLYQTEHGGAYPTNNTTIVGQLTTYTDSSGNTNPTKDSTHTFGPYLRQVPPLPVGGATEKGQTTIGATATGGPPSSVVSGGLGWLYDGAGSLYPNTGSLTDASGKAYNTY